MSESEMRMSLRWNWILNCGRTNFFAIRICKPISAILTQGSPNDYLNEKSFQLEKYEDKLKFALSEEPTLINGLLYRTFQAKADFEEDTYLDLYIYQTGKKLGKQATGVENYFETEKLILEATQDMMKDKKKRNADADGESFYEIEKKTQEAYRKGDLDMLDSLGTHDATLCRLPGKISIQEK